jgi:hypothetical protein
VFVPVSVGALQGEWSYVRQAAKYAAWQEAQVWACAFALTAAQRALCGMEHGVITPSSKRPAAGFPAPCCGPCDAMRLPSVPASPDASLPLAMPQAAGAPQGNSNAFVGEQWSLRAQRMVFQNSRGPGCFDFDHYVKVNGRSSSSVASCGFACQAWKAMLWMPPNC